MAGLTFRVAACACGAAPAERAAVPGCLPLPERPELFLGLPEACGASAPPSQVGEEGLPWRAAELGAAGALDATSRQEIGGLLASETWPGT